MRTSEAVAWSVCSAMELTVTIEVVGTNPVQRPEHARREETVED